MVRGLTLSTTVGQVWAWVGVATTAIKTMTKTKAFGQSVVGAVFSLIRSAEAPDPHMVRGINFLQDRPNLSRAPGSQGRFLKKHRFCHILRKFRPVYRSARFRMHEAGSGGSGGCASG